MAATTTQHNGTFQDNNTQKSILDEVTLSDLGWFILINLLLFEPALQASFPVFANTDETATVLIVLLGLLETIRHGGSIWDKRQAMVLYIYFGLVFITLIGNFTNELQISWIPVFIDLFTCSKFVFVIIFGALFLRDRVHVVRMLSAEFKVLLVVMAACGVLSQFIEIGMVGDTRYGMNSFEFVFPHPAYMSFALVCMLVIFLTDRRRNRFWIYLIFGLMILSLRSKDIGFVVLMLVLLLTVGQGKRPSVIHLVIGIAVAVYLGYDQFSFYYGNIESARLELTNASVAIANAHFPFGTGFGTFASSITASPEYYSPLYYTYGLNTVYGLIPGNVSFLSDTFWPIVVGQFGWIGTMLFVAMLIVLIVWSYRSTRKLDGLPAIALFMYLLICSTAETAFFNPSAVCLAVCFCMVLPSMKQRKEQVEAK